MICISLYLWTQCWTGDCRCAFYTCKWYVSHTLWPPGAAISIGVPSCRSSKLEKVLLHRASRRVHITLFGFITHSFCLSLIIVIIAQNCMRFIVRDRRDIMTWLHVCSYWIYLYLHFTYFAKIMLFNLTKIIISLIDWH